MRLHCTAALCHCPMATHCLALGGAHTSMYGASICLMYGVAGLMYGIGDFSAQKMERVLGIQSKGKTSFNYERFTRMAVFGGFIAGPLLAIWYQCCCCCWPSGASAAAALLVQLLVVLVLLLLLGWRYSWCFAGAIAAVLVLLLLICHCAVAADVALCSGTRCCTR